MKRENKKGVDALDGKLSKLVAELRTVVENQGEEIEKNQKFAIKLKKQVDINEQLMETKSDSD